MSNAGSTISISDLYALVKTYDKKFSPKPVNPALLNEDGTLLVVYHGTDADFTVFDRTKGRSNMDIQGMFFSPWEIDAQGYGPKVGAYYINLKNPADEGTAFKALNMFQGQNGAGIKARDYLIKQGYDGVNNSGEEFIAFYPEQIKSATDNIGTFDSDNPDIRYSTREEEVDSEERKVYNRKGAYKRISKEEYAIISGRIMEDNSKYMARNQKLPRYGTARSADYFYLYENFTPGNFGVLKQIKITDANRELIASVEARKGENNGVQTFGSAGKSNRLLEFLETQSRGSNSNNAIDSKGRTNRKNGEISLGESESNGIGSSREGVRNKRIENSLREESYPRTFADSLTEPTKYQTRDGSGTKDQPDFTAIENKKEITVLCPLQWIPQSRLTINMPEIKENLPQVNPQLHNSLGIINDKSSKNIVSDSGAKVNAFLIICSNFMWKKLSLPKAEILFQEHMNSKYTKNSRTT